MERGLQKILETPKALKHELDRNSKILDLGCGNGETVYDLREYGYPAFGCDLKFKAGTNVKDLAEKELIRIIQPEPYRLPFQDNSFDYVFSTQVFEHVQDYSSTLKEIHRVLKPGGISIHEFPARYRVIESHVFVPFASILQQYWWLWLWAKLGIRKSSQAHLSAKEVAASNYQYLSQNTTYYTKKQIRKFVYEYFDNCYFCELEAARFSRLYKVYGLVKNIPFFDQILSAFQTRVLCFKKHSSFENID